MSFFADGISAIAHEVQQWPSAPFILRITRLVLSRNFGSRHPLRFKFRIRRQNYLLIKQDRFSCNFWKLSWTKAHGAIYLITVRNRAAENRGRRIATRRTPIPDAGVVRMYRMKTA